MFERNRAISLMEEKEIDGLLITSGENIYYTTGFYSGLAYLASSFPGVTVAIVPKDDEPCLMVMDFEEYEAEKYAQIKDISSYKSWVGLTNREVYQTGKVPAPTQPSKIESERTLNLIIKKIREKKLTNKTIGIETDDLTPRLYMEIQKMLPNAKLVDTKDFFFELRKIKTPEEIEIIRKTAKIDQKAVEAMLNSAKAGVSERELYGIFAQACLKFGSDGVLYCQIGTAANSSTAHTPAQYGDKKLESGEILRCDAGCTLKGYSSDICTHCAVDRATDKQKKLYRVLYQAQRKAIDAMKPGVKLSDIFRIGQNYVRENGFPWYTRGHIGHSIGGAAFLEEPPLITPSQQEVLKPKMTFCVELPCYIDRAFGLSVEDEVLITEDGHELLTNLSTPELRIL